MVAEETKAAKQESVSSESESEEEAEYHPNVSICHTQIPEEKEEEEEQQEEEKTAEEQVDSATDAPSLPITVSQPVEEEESRKEDAEKNAEEEKKAERETEESIDDPMITPDETPNGHNLLPEETGTVTTEEEEEEPKMNGEASLVEAEHRPHVICCSEVKSSLGRLRSFSPEL